MPECRTLLLQGPVGPFFRGLATELQRRGDWVRQVVFNGGDAFSKDDVTLPYRGSDELAAVVVTIT